jgi:hypothetical protein
MTYTGADPGFQVRGGGAHKKIAPSGGRHEHFWVFRVTPPPGSVPAINTEFLGDDRAILRVGVFRRMTFHCQILNIP